MSFIIQGVDLPKGYKALHMRVQSDGVVRYVIEGDDPVHIIDGACAIQIPKGHGRLIDKDELLSHLKKDPLFSMVEQYGISGVIESRPTILEAEENA